MKWIFTDCFDTLLLRKYSPETVKRRWSKDVSASLNYALSYQKIYEIRKNSELVMSQYYSYQDLCDEMIRRIRICLSGEMSFIDNLKDIMYRLELKNEIEGLQVNTEHLQLLKDSPLKKALVSDMYCGEDFIWELLKAFEISEYIDRVFVSCDCKAEKIDLNKSLYKKVLGELQIEPKEAIMYDDMEMCCYCADQCQIQTVRVKKKLYNPKANEYKMAEAKVKDTLDTNYNAPNSLTNYVASFYLFTERLYKECIKEKIDKVFFLSREGEFLKKLFDQYSLKQSYGIKTEYLYVSRRAVLSASFSNDPYNPGEQIKKVYRFTSIGNILKNIGFSNDEIEELKKLFDIDMDLRLENYWECDIWKSLCNDKTFAERYECYVNKRKDTFSKYLKQSGFLENNKIAIVDVGWKGTMQDALISFRHQSTGINGYYFGVTEYAKSEINNIKKGLIFSASDGRSTDYEIWSFYHTQTESVLTASHSGVFSYDVSDNGQVVPVFQEWGSEENSYQMMLPIQEQILNKFNCICSVMEQFGYDGEDFYLFFLKIHIKTILTFGKAKSIFLRQLQYNQIDNLVSGKSNSADMVHSYGLMQNFRRIFRNLDTLKNPVRMIRILQTNNLHFFIPLVIRKVKKQFIKQAKYRNYKV